MENLKPRAVFVRPLFGAEIGEGLQKQYEIEHPAADQQDRNAFEIQ